jgi:glutamate N-acetyltransferase/amino-acid N-acetyltransferase
VPLDPSRLTLLIAPREDVADLSGDALTLVRGGVPTAYSEEHATAIFNGATIFILLTCGQGDGWATVWTCDLSHDYVSINGHYRS